MGGWERGSVEVGSADSGLMAVVVVEHASVKQIGMAEVVVVPVRMREVDTDRWERPAGILSVCCLQVIEIGSTLSDGAVDRVSPFARPFSHARYPEHITATEISQSARQRGHAVCCGSPRHRTHILQGHRAGHAPLIASQGCDRCCPRSRPTTS